MDAILLSRRDTFKEQITRAYANKELDLAFYIERCASMEANESLYQKTVKEKDMLAVQNEELESEIAELKQTSLKESS